MAAAPKSGYVIDSSAILALLLPDEQQKPFALKIIKLIENQPIYAPKLVNYEVANGIKSAFLRHRLDQKSTTILWKNFRKIPLQTLPLNFSRIIKLSITTNLSVYDASYVYLAQKYHFPLLSFDKKLSRLF